jgi:DegV family protein with EDD domain
MKIKITADSTADLSKELIEKYDIRIVPLHIIKDDGSDSLDGITIHPADIFNYVENGGLCHTAAVNIDEYINVFKEELQEHDAVIHINISSDFSACYQNACVAASDLGNVYVVDSRNLSTGSGHLVLDAAIMAQQGMEPADIKAKLDAMAEKVEASFVIDTLAYLHKGGRCSGIAMLGANVLKLKPCIEVIDGKMQVGKKYRGSIEKALKAYVKERLENRDDLDPRRIFITYSSCEPALLADIHKQVEDMGIFEEIIETNAGCTVCNHCGPGTLGVLFYRK